MPMAIACGDRAKERSIDQTLACVKNRKNNRTTRNSIDGTTLDVILREGVRERVEERRITLQTYNAQ